MKTITTKPSEIVRKWYLVDADGLVLGRVASKIAQILRGKHRPIYSPHADCGDFVVVVNAGKIRFTGAKGVDKIYFHHTGYPTGGKYESLKTLLDRKPTEPLRHAVHGMLPKGPLGRQIMTKLKVFAGPEHRHQAQQPVPLELGKKR